jgi:hypothetical protein
MKFVVVAGVLMAFVLACAPDLDLAASRVFYAGGGHFVGEVPAGFIARDIARLTPFFLLAGLMLLHLARRLGWLAARYAPDGRSLAFLALSLAIGPGLIVDGVLKDHVHRPRPVEVRQFGGKLDFQPYYRIAGPCPRNCSFPSGDAGAAHRGGASVRRRDWASAHEFRQAFSLGRDMCRPDHACLHRRVAAAVAAGA